MIIKCASCGGEIRYDIAAGKLVCGHCGAPYEAPENGPGKQMDVQVLRCESCGAEIFTNGETDVTALCSFCGSTNILKKRLENIRRPDGIIPFKITREQCAGLYRKRVRRTPLTPGGGSDIAGSFRAIYMPFWRYTVKIDAWGEIHKHVGSKRDGLFSDYSIETYEVFSCRMRGETTGPFHDASSAFNDDISEAIGDVDFRDAVPFEPAYLNGFYADRADLTEPDTAEQMKNQTGQKLAMDMGINRQVPVTLSEGELVYFPVWCMRRDYGGRTYNVAVNGVTGKVVTNMPVSKAGLLSLIAVIALAACLLFFAVLPSNSMRMTGMWYKLSYILLWLMTAGGLAMRWCFARRQKHLDPENYNDSRDRVKNIVFTVAIILCAVLAYTGALHKYNRPLERFLLGTLLFLLLSFNTIQICSAYRRFNGRDVTRKNREEGEILV